MTLVRRQSKAMKALALIAEKRIFSANSSVFITEGEDGTYITTVLHVTNEDGSNGKAYVGSCTCKYKRENPERSKECYHLVAALALANRFSDSE